jgi:hypothetical protein
MRSPKRPRFTKIPNLGQESTSGVEGAPSAKTALRETLSTGSQHSPAALQLAESPRQQGSQGKKRPRSDEQDINNYPKEPSSSRPALDIEASGHHQEYVSLPRPPIIASATGSEATFAPQAVLDSPTTASSTVNGSPQGINLRQIITNMRKRISIQDSQIRYLKDENKKNESSRLEYSKNLHNLQEIIETQAKNQHNLQETIETLAKKIHALEAAFHQQATLPPLQPPNQIIVTSTEAYGSVIKNLYITEPSRTRGGRQRHFDYNRNIQQRPQPHLNAHGL